MIWRIDLKTVGGKENKPSLLGTNNQQFCKLQSVSAIHLKITSYKTHLTSIGPTVSNENLDFSKEELLRSYKVVGKEVDWMELGGLEF